MDNKYTINCKRGETILEALRRQGITIKAFCNGRHTCGKCRIRILESIKDNPSYDLKIGLLNEVTAEENAFLSKEEIESGTRLACIAKPENNDINSISIQIIDELENQAPILTETNELINNIINNYSDENVFAAIDLGTTTIAAKLIKDGKEVCTITRRNSQCSYGADVISRSEASILGKTDELSNCIMDDINEIVNEFPVEPKYIVFAGNTTIIHLMMAYPLNGMVNYPYTPYYSGWHKDTIMLDSGKIIPCTIMPNQSAYIGGDIVAGLYYCDFANNDKISLFVDLGTNGEMAIGNKSQILTASAAAGPAFEGTRINVATDVVECMANMRKSGIIDENGLLKDPYFDTGYPYKIKNSNEYVNITQKDIRDIQMAKSAIRSGITLLIRKFGIGPADIDRLFLAGGMGHSLNVDCAVYIGLLPAELRDKAVMVGNTSLAGCIKYGLSGYNDDEIERILKISSEMVLSNVDDFQKMYYEYMMFE